ncbi:MAG: hypothetical protein ACHQ7M_12055 [Chloroflexota bacterium]
MPPEQATFASPVLLISAEVLPGEISVKGGAERHRVRDALRAAGAPR